MSSILVANALNALGITEYILRGTPTNEAEFNSMFKKVVGEDSNGVAIESSDAFKFGVNWSQVQSKITEQETAFSNDAYKRSRAEEYPSIADQLDDLYHNGIDGWKTTIKAIKDKHPKE